MNDNLGLIPVNEKQEYHDCEMTFCFYYDHEKSDFKVQKDQKYKIYTTIKEVELLNEALNIYQEDGFKDTYLLFEREADGASKYPEFASRLSRAKEIARALAGLAKDECNLVQLSEHCLEVAPTYVDDFGINKQIESITINGTKREIKGYEDLKDFISQLNQ